MSWKIPRELDRRDNHLGLVGVPYDLPWEASPKKGYFAGNPIRGVFPRGIVGNPTIRGIPAGSPISLLGVFPAESRGKTDGDTWNMGHVEYHGVPFRAPEPLPILNPSDFVPKNGFPVVKGLKAPTDLVGLCVVRSRGLFLPPTEARGIPCIMSSHI